MTAHVPRSNKVALPPRCFCLGCDYYWVGYHGPALARQHVVETGHRVKAQQGITWDYLPPEEHLESAYDAPGGGSA